MNKIKIIVVSFILIFAFFLMFDQFGLVESYNIKISYYVYALGFASVMLQIFFCDWVTISLYLPLVVTMTGYFFCKILLDDVQTLTQFEQITTTSIEIILLTALTCAAWLFSKIISDIDRSIMMMLQAENRYKISTINQERSPIEREIDRSRRYNRPLSVIVINVDDAVNGKPVEPVKLERFSSYITKEYLFMTICGVFSKNKRSHDLLARMNRENRLVLICPETSQHEAEAYMVNMGREVKNKLGFDLITGVSTFPEDSTTLDELIAGAEATFDNSTDTVEDSSIYYIEKN